MLLWIIACVAPGDDPENVFPPILEGDPSTIAWDALAVTEAPDPAPDQIRDGGAFDYVDGQLSVFLTKEATIRQVNDLAEDLDATLVASDGRLGHLVLAVGSSSDVRADRATANAHAAVEAASLVILHHAQALPPGHASPAGLDWVWDQADKANWGLEFVRAPAVWNLEAALRDQRDFIPRIVIAEEGWASHEDLAAPAAGTADAHGNAVAGLYAAQWDDKGIEAIFPALATLDLSPALNHVVYNATVTTTAQLQSRFFDAIVAARDVGDAVILNLSAGNQPVHCEAGDGKRTCEQHTFEEGSDLADDMEAEGQAWKTWADRVDEWQVTDKWLMVCSAGNTWISDALGGDDANWEGLEPYAYAAWMNSGCGYAASKLDAQQFVVVEALERGGATLWDEANPNGSAGGGTLSAPGHAVGVLGTSGYHAGDGTSYAAPMVGSALSVLWTLAPEASRSQVREALLDGAQPASGRSAARLDAWGAVRALDTSAELGLDLWVGDLDDGSIDGSLRREPGGSTTPWSGIRGDGCVDMRDLRALRDALLDAQRDGHEALNGGWDHRLRDQNLDGEVQYVTSETWAPDESDHSRFDLDGDGSVSFADAAVLARAWGSCRGSLGPAQTEGVAATELDAYLNSFDLWIDLDQPTGVHVLGHDAFSADPAVLADRMHLGHFLYTVPLDSCGEVEVRVGTGVFRAGDTQAGEDLVFGLDTESTLKLDSPLVYHRTGGSIGELALHTSISDSYTALPVLTDFLASPQHERVAGSGSKEVTFADKAGSSGDLNIPGADGDFIPIHWNDRGTGVLARNFFGFEDQYAYVDVEKGAAWLLGEGVDLDWDDWPGLWDDWAFFIGSDDILYRQLLKPPTTPLSEDELLDWLDGLHNASCSDGSGELPEAIFDFAGQGAPSLVHAVPSSLSPLGHALVKVFDGVDFDLVLVSPDGTVAETLLTDWLPRGGAETQSLFWPAEGVAWLPDGKGFLLVDSDGTYAVSWAVDGVPTAGDLSFFHLTTEKGPISVSPSGTHFVQQIVEGPVQDRTSTLYLYTLSGTAVGSPILWARPEWGQPTWSPDGAYLAYVRAEIRLKPDLHVVSASSGADVWSTEGWSDGSTETHEIRPSWGLDTWGW